MNILLLCSETAGGEDGSKADQLQDADVGDKA